MIRATDVLPPKSFPETAVIDRVVLDYDDRHRRRMAMEGVEGTAFLLDLAEAVPLISDAGLKLEDGRVVLVVAAAEPLAEIRTSDPNHMVRVAWHLGNRHLPTQIMGNRLRIRRDHVIEDMVRGLGARVVAIEAPFDPEGGAYGHGTVTGHDHGHSHGHGHAHAHDHGHDHGHSHGHHHHDHSHDHGHSHDRGHSHAPKPRDVLAVTSPGHVHDESCGCGHDHHHDDHHDHAHGDGHHHGHDHKHG